MQVCSECSLRQTTAFLSLTASELCFVSEARKGVFRCRRGSELLDQRLNHRHVLTITKGWAYHYVSGPDGLVSIRDFLIPGDWAYLDAFRLEGIRPAGVRAITDVEVCVLSYPDLYRMFDTQPDLVKKLVRTLFLDRYRLDRRQAVFGRGVASQRTGYLFLELQDRTRPLGLGGEDWFPFPVRRQHLEDALELSRAQLSRALSHLRDAGLATFERGMVKIKDRPALEKLCGYVAHADTRRLLL